MAERIPLLIIGNPGDLATKVLEGARASSDLVPVEMNIQGRRGIVTLTGEKIKDQTIDSAFINNYFDQTGVHLIPPVDHEATITTARDMYPRMIAMNCANAEGFPVNFDLVRNNVPTLFAGTGVKPEEQTRLAQEVVSRKGLYLPLTNMALQLVDLMDFTSRYAQANPRGFEGCSLNIREIHQQTKKDASGTGLKFAEYFMAMGMELDLDKVRAVRLEGKPIDTTVQMGPNSSFTMIRDPETMFKLGVNRKYAGGLGWHKYDILTTGSEKEAQKQVLSFYRALKQEFFKGSPFLDSFNVRLFGDRFCSALSSDETMLLNVDTDGSCRSLSLMHNINGRGPYVSGGLRALPFLSAMAEAGEIGKVLSGGDVLKYFRTK